MELFQRAKTVRLKSHHDKYLYADEDETKVTQDRNGALTNARWLVEPVYHGGNLPQALRFKSRYGRYLTASNEPFLLGVTGRKVLQTAVSGRADSSLEWEPVRDGHQVRLKTRYGNYLRGNGGFPPWRNSVTHDVPHRTATQDWVLWDVEIVEIATPKPDAPPVNNPVPPVREIGSWNRPEPATDHKRHNSVSAGHGMVGKSEHSERPRPTLQPMESMNMPLHKVDGRQIYYQIADDKGNVDTAHEGEHFTFDGTSLEELTQKLRELTGLTDIIVCNRNVINQKLVPLRLQLPPNNAAMHIVIVEESSKVAKTFGFPYS